MDIRKYEAGSQMALEDIYKRGLWFAEALVKNLKAHGNNGDTAKGYMEAVRAYKEAAKAYGEG